MPYLLIDDLGVQRNTEWETEALYSLVEARYSQERFTVVTINQPLEEINRFWASARGLVGRCCGVEISCGVTLDNLTCEQWEPRM